MEAWHQGEEMGQEGVVVPAYHNPVDIKVGAVYARANVEI